MQENPTFVPVVAVAMLDAQGRVLMQRRRVGAAHGGLWEFPGGKVEQGESPEGALVREIAEELGVALDRSALVPCTFSSDPALPPAPRQPHVILLYTCHRWDGEPRALDAEAIAWCAAAELDRLEMPPLDYPLAEVLKKVI